MISFKKYEFRWVKPVLVLFLLAGGIPVMSEYGFFPARRVAEGVSVILAFLIYVLSTRTHRFSRKYYLLFLGHVFLALGVIDLVYLLSLEGMEIPAVPDIDGAFKLRISAGYILAVSFLAAPYAKKLELASSSLFMLFSGIAAIILISVFRSVLIPSCFIPGEGMTSFMIVSEYIIVFLLLLSMIDILLKKDLLNTCTRVILTVSIGLIILAESFAVFSSSPAGDMNIWVYILELAAFYLIYEGVAARGLDDPYEHMFEEVKRSSILDNLTGLYNRGGYRELSCKIWEYARREGESMSLMIMDLDNFKQVNDTMGHREGDKVLKKVGELITLNTRATDVIARMGGDEFVVVAKGDPSGLRLVQGRIQAQLSRSMESGTFPSFIGMSFGISEITPSEECIRDLEVLFHEADMAMYSHKLLKRGRPFASISEKEKEVVERYEKGEDRK
jgi:diguanylate cyclase (GGDEF)-like protein